MPLDPSIPLSALRNNVQPEGQADWMKNAYSLVQMQQARQLNELKLREAQQQQRDQANIRNAYSQGGTPDEIADRVMQYSPQTAMELKKAIRDAQSSDTVAKKNAFDFFQKRSDAWKQRLGALIQAPAELQSQMWPQFAEEAIQNGLALPEHLPAQFDPAWAQQQGLQTLEFDKQLEEMRAEAAAQRQAEDALKPQPFGGAFDSEGQHVQPIVQKNAEGKWEISNKYMGKTSPKPDQSLTETELALKAAQGDQEALRALEMLNKEKAPRPVPGRDVPYSPEVEAQRLKMNASRAQQGRPVTSGDANRLSDFTTGLSDLKTLRETIPAGTTGNMAKIGAALPNFVTGLPGHLGQEAKQKQAVIDRVKQVIGKTLEGGVLRKEDEYKYEKILPTIADTAAVVKTKLEGLQAAITQRRDTQLDSLEDAGYEVGKYRARSGGGTKDLDEATAVQFLRRAGGDKEKARAAARAAGYSVK